MAGIQTGYERKTGDEASLEFHQLRCDKFHPDTLTVKVDGEKVAEFNPQQTPSIQHRLFYIDTRLAIASRDEHGELMLANIWIPNPAEAEGEQFFEKTYGEGQTYKVKFTPCEDTHGWKEWIATIEYESPMSFGASELPKASLSKRE